MSITSHQNAISRSGHASVVRPKRLALPATLTRALGGALLWGAAVLGVGLQSASGQPVNDNCGSATAVGGGTFPFTLVGATNDAEGSCGATETAPDVWFAYTAAATGPARVETCGLAAFDTVLAIFASCGGPEIACNDDECGTLSAIDFAASAGTTYFIRVAGFNGAIGSGSIRTSPGGGPGCDCADSYVTAALSEGTQDNFVGPEPAMPGSDLIQFLTCTSGARGFDDLSANKCFGHTFQGFTSTLKTATLTLHMGVGSIAGSANDTIALQVRRGCTDRFVWSRFIGAGNIPGDTGLVNFVWTANSRATVTLDLSALPTVTGGLINLLPYINADGRLDIHSQDDTGFDYATLEYTYCELDCNGNDIRDSCDIESGYSLDCNMNGVPDECEDCSLRAYHGIPTASVRSPGQTLWYRTLGARRTVMRRVGDIFGKGEIHLISRAAPEDASGSFNPDRVEVRHYPADGTTYKQERAKRRCDIDGVPPVCGANPDPDCYGAYFVPSPEEASFLHDHAITFGAPNFCNPVSLDVAIYDRDPAILGFLYYLLFATALVLGCIATTPLGCTLIVGAFVQLLPVLGVDLTRDYELGMIDTQLSSPTPTFVGYQTSCEQLAFGNNGLMEVQWGLFPASVAGSANSSPPNTPPCFSPLTPGTLQDVEYFGYGQDGASLRFFCRVGDASLRDPALVGISPGQPGTRTLCVAIDADNDITTGDQAPPFCGADCRVCIRQVSNGTNMTTTTTVECWTCPCPGQAAEWVPQPHAHPYNFFLGNTEVAISVNFRDIGNPTCAMASWAVLESEGGVVRTQPLAPCSDRLEITRSPDTMCPRVSAVQIVDAAAQTIAQPILITFSEPMGPISLSQVQLNPAQPFSISLDASRTILTVRSTSASQKFPAGRYTLVLDDSITDEWGNQIDGNRDFVCGDPYILRFCVPDDEFHTTDSAGTAKDIYASGEDIYFTGTSFDPGFHLFYLVHADDVYSPGIPLADQSVDGPDLVIVPGSGNILTPRNLGAAVVDAEYNIVQDINGDGRFQLTDRVLNPCDTGLLVGHPCNQGLDGTVAWWTFDEATPLGPVAEVIALNHGTVVGDASAPAPGVVGNAAREFFGGSYVNVPSTIDSALDFGSDSFSIDAWIRTGMSKGIAPIVDKRTSATSYIGYALYLSNGTLTFVMGGDPGNGNPPVLRTYGGAVPNIADNNWHHVAVTVARGPNETPRVRLFVDGAVVATSNQPVTQSVTNVTDLRIGATRIGEPLSLLIGALDELQFFDRALARTEVNWIYTQGPRGKCTDKGGPPEPCPCDWNGDVILNSQDFFDFVNVLFAGDADFNGDSLTNSQDFFDFLNCFFNPPNGCP